jgi:hypothetical protein
LAGALQEYLEDPNFEQNRIEYKTNKEALERGFQPTTNREKPETCEESLSKRLLENFPD